MTPRQNLKPQKGLGTVITRRRRQALKELQKESEARETSARARAREALSRAAQVESNDFDRWKENLLASVAANQTAVVRSYGLSIPVDSRVIPNWYRQRLVAYTDFKSIHVRWPTSDIPRREASFDEHVATVAAMRGVFQHELGHLLFTVPLGTLWNRVKDIKDWGSIGPNTVRLSWNLIEDQRMEMAMVKAVPRLAHYFTPMVVGHLTKGGDRTWLLVAGRSYLPQDVRDLARQEFVAEHGEDKAQEWYDIVAWYKAADTDMELWEGVLAAHRFLVGNLLSDTDNTTSEHYNADDGVDTDAGAGSTQEDESDGDDSDSDASESAGTDTEDEAGEGDEPAEDGAGTDAGDASDDADTEDGEGTGAGTDADGETDTSTSEASAGRGASTDSGRDWNDVLQDALQQSNDVIQGDKDNHTVVSNAYDTTSRGGTLSNASFSGVDLSERSTARAEATAVGVEQALSEFVTASAPVWRSHQDTGVIEALPFRTRRAGERDYHRFFEGNAASGIDLHVSMLCDASVSMDGEPIVALSEAMYATAIACRNLGIGTTYVLWSGDRSSYRVWEDGNIGPVQWPTLGGTDPTMALDDLSAHNPEEASNHLVIIFTDGEWGVDVNLQDYADQGRHIVLVRYGYGLRNGYNADEVVDITHIDQLPGELSMAIARILS